MTENQIADKINQMIGISQSEVLENIQRNPTLIHWYEQMIEANKYWALDLKEIYEDDKSVNTVAETVGLALNFIHKWSQQISSLIWNLDVPIISYDRDGGVDIYFPNMHYLINVSMNHSLSFYHSESNESGKFNIQENFDKAFKGLPTPKLKYDDTKNIFR